MGRLTALVEGDPALASRVVHFVNSPCYGVSRRVLDVPTALEYLGVGTLRHLVLTVRVRTTFPARSLPARAAEDLERHARLTAHIARQLVDDPAQADAAFLGGSSTTAASSSSSTGWPTPSGRPPPGPAAAAARSTRRSEP
jgi:HD-like signal output (HDOD) protein